MPRTTAKDHDHKRGKILKSAARVFATQGYNGVSVTQLAQACGISKANIYHYYDNKQTVLFDLLDSYLKALRNRIQALDLKGLTAEEQLRKTIAEIMLAYQGADNEHLTLISSISALPKKRQELLRAYQREIVACVSRIVAPLVSRQTANDAKKLRHATMALFGMMNWYFIWKRKATPEEREEYAQLVSDLALRGLSAL